MDSKVCRVCKEEKTLDNFTKHKLTKDRLRHECRSCRNTERREWCKNNRELVNSIRRRSYAKNPETKKAMDKRYYLKNKERIIRQTTEYKKNKISNCIITRFKVRISHRIRSAFKYIGEEKSTTTSNIVGCSREFLKKHLINTFKLNYNEEYNPDIHKVHIDHIIPISTASTKEDVIRLNHYSNLQLLLDRDNMRKSNRLDFKIGETK